MQGVCHAVIQRIKVLAKMRGQCELASNQVQDVLLALCFRQIGIQKMLAQTLGCFLQIAHAKRTNRLDDVRPYTLQRCLLVLSNGLVHRRSHSLNF